MKKTLSRSKEKRIIHPMGKTGIYLIENFLSKKECSELIRLAKKKGLIKGAFGKKKNDKYGDESESISLKDDSSPLIEHIHNQIEELTSIPKENGEFTRIVRYGVGGTYEEHNDFHPYDKDSGTSGRIAQMLLYLNDVKSGGETFFSKLGIKIVPKAGRALIWYGVNGMNFPEDKKMRIPRKQKENPLALHQPLPVKEGEKWVMALFIHDRDRSKRKSKVNWDNLKYTYT